MTRTFLVQPQMWPDNQRVGVVRALNRLDDAVLPERWRRREKDPVRLGVQQIYMGGAVLLLGLVLLVATGNLVGVVIGACNMLVGAVRINAGLRPKQVPHVDE